MNIIDVYFENSDTLQYFMEDFNGVQKDVILDVVGNKDIRSFYADMGMKHTGNIVESYMKNGKIDSPNSEYDVKVALNEISNFNFSDDIKSHKEIREGINYLKMKKYKVHNILTKKLSAGNYVEIVKDTETLMNLFDSKMLSEKSNNEYEIFRENIKKIGSSANLLSKNISSLDPTGYVKSSFFIEKFNARKYKRFIEPIEIFFGKNATVGYDHKESISHGSDIIDVGATNIVAALNDLEIIKNENILKLSDVYSDMAVLLNYIPHNRVVI